MNRVIRRFIIAILILLTILFSIFACMSSLWNLNVVDDNKEKWTRIDSGWVISRDFNSTKANSLILTRDFYPNEFDKIMNYREDSIKRDIPYLFFTTHNLRVRVLANIGNGYRQVYSFGNNGRQIVGSDSGNAIHCVKIPVSDNGKIEITLQFEPCSELKYFSPRINNMKIPKIYCGSRSNCLSSFIYSSVYQIVPIIIMLILMAFALFIYFATLILRRINIKQYLYLGVFAFLCVIGFFLESNMVLILIKNSFFVYLLSTIILAVLPAVFIAYLRERTSISKQDKITNIVIILSSINVLLICVAALQTTFPFHVVRLYLGFVLSCFALFMIIAIVKETILLSSRFSIFDISVFISGIVIIIDVITIFFGRSPIDIFFLSRISFLFFFFVCAFTTTSEFFDGEILKARSNMLQRAAYTDILTDCLNTAALWRDNKIFQLEQKGFSMALVNIRNISEINIKDGYSTGDEVVKVVSQSLQKKFSITNVYRLNGAKFCILLLNNEIDVFSEKFYEIRKEIDEYNKQNLTHPIELSGVGSRYNPSVDHNFDGIFIRLLEQIK